MIARWKYLIFLVIAIPLLWYITASLFFSKNVYSSYILHSLPLPGNARQVAVIEDIGSRNYLCHQIGVSKLYITDQSWDEVNQFYLNYFRLHYPDAVVRAYPDAEKDQLTIFQSMNKNIMTLQERSLTLSVRRIEAVSPNYGIHLWTSADETLPATVAQANTAYDLSIRYIDDGDAYQENCTD